MARPLGDKVAVITGATSDIGLATVACSSKPAPVCLPPTCGFSVSVAGW